MVQKWDLIDLDMSEKGIQKVSEIELKPCPVCGRMPKVKRDYGYEASGYDLNTILQMNVKRLRDRYPNGFDEERSKHRKKDDI